MNGGNANPETARGCLADVAAVVAAVLIASVLLACCGGLVRAAEADPCVVDGIDGPRPCASLPSNRSN